MAQVYDEGLKQADLLVLASPVYTDGMSAQLKAVIDRSICAMQPFLKPDGEGRLRHPLWWPLPWSFLLVATCGFPEPKTFAPLVAAFRAQAANFGTRALAEVCVPGSIVRPQALEGHLDLLHRAGRELARGARSPRSSAGPDERTAPEPGGVPGDSQELQGDLPPTPGAGRGLSRTHTG